MNHMELVYLITLVESILEEKREWVEQQFGTRSIPIYHEIMAKLNAQIEAVRSTE